jgi:hypothetical protein
MVAGAQGCEVAFHLAAQLGDYGDWEDFERGNAGPVKVDQDAEPAGSIGC